MEVRLRTAPHRLPPHSVPHRILRNNSHELPVGGRRRYVTLVGFTPILGGRPILSRISASGKSQPLSQPQGTLMRPRRSTRCKVFFQVHNLASSSPRPKHRRTRFQLELLEDRCLLSSAPLPLLSSDPGAPASLYLNFMGDYKATRGEPLFLGEDVGRWKWPAASRSSCPPKRKS